MPFKSIERTCLQCPVKLRLRNSRDLVRKKFCSHRCRQLWRYGAGEFTWLTAFSAAGSTPESNKKKGLPGDKNPKWKIDREAVKTRSRYEGRAWKQAVFVRDNYTCRKCGERGGRLNAHHIKPYALYPELRWEVSNGETLCIDCHKQTDSYGWKLKNALCQQQAA